MEKKAFALKYRPAKINQLDLPEVRERLARMVAADKVAHALLFAGPRGIGKTSAARLVAKAVNCLTRKPGEAEPCGECEACVSISQNRAVDILEIDGASNRGIDDIRDLREKVRLAPVALKNKVYIIDEVHMLTGEAFNALLKTLEEPPVSTIFILATTDPEKLPATIVSRCVRVNFRKASEAEIVASLERVVKGEKMKVERGVLKAIAGSVEGSFRDAHKVLDQLGADGTISLTETLAMLGRNERTTPDKLLVKFAAGDLAGSLTEIGRAAESGADWGHYTRGLLEKLRAALLVKAGVGEEVPELAGLEMDELKRLIEILTAAAREVRTHPIPQLPLELAAVEWCQINIINHKSKIKNGDEKREEMKSDQEKTANEVKKETGQKESDDLKKGKTVITGGEKKPVVEDEPKPSPVNGDGLRLVQEKWNELMKLIRPRNHSIEALLRSARPLDLHNGILTLEVFYRFHKERLEEGKIRNIFEEVAGEVLATPVRLKCVLGQKPVRRNTFEDTAPGVRVSERADGGEVDIEGGEDIIKAAEEIFGN